jgi:hypothetical protein
MNVGSARVTLVFDPIACTGEGGHKARPYKNQFFVGATFMVALTRSTNGC